MKPVIKKQTHYNVLLMREDGNARTFRLNRVVLRILLFLFFFLMIGGGASIYGGIHFWEKYRSLSKQAHMQEKEMSEMRLQLERLVNLESLIAASNGSLPQARHEEIGVPATRNLNGTSAPIASGNGSVPAAASANATRPVNATSPATAAGETPPATNATSAPESGNTVQGDGVETSSAAPASPTHPSIFTDGSPLHIGNFIGQVAGQQRLRISYELSKVQNDDQGGMISGTARYIAAFANGTRMELSLYDMDGTRFAMTRMKPMHSTARLPRGYRAADVETVDVIIEVSEGSTYQDSFVIMK